MRDPKEKSTKKRWTGESALFLLVMFVATAAMAKAPAKQEKAGHHRYGSVYGSPTHTYGNPAVGATMQCIGSDGSTLAWASCSGLPSYWPDNSTTGSLQILPNGADATPLIVGPAAGVVKPGSDLFDVYTGYLTAPASVSGPTVASGGSIPAGDVVTACVTINSPTGSTPCSASGTSAAATSAKQSVTIGAPSFEAGATTWSIYAAACASPGPCTGLTLQTSSANFTTSAARVNLISITTTGAAPPVSNTALSGEALGVAANGTINLPLSYNWTLGANNQPSASFVRLYGGVEAEAYNQFLSPALPSPTAPAYSLLTTGGSIGTSPAAVTVAYSLVNGNGETVPGMSTLISLSSCTAGKCSISLSPPAQNYATGWNLYLNNGANTVLVNSSPITSFSTNYSIGSIPETPVNAGPSANTTGAAFQTTISAAPGANGVACVNSGVPAFDCAAGTFIQTNPMTQAGELEFGGSVNAEGMAVPAVDPGNLTYNSTTHSLTVAGTLTADSFLSTATGPAIMSGTEGTCSGAASGKDVLCAGDGTTHTVQISLNGGPFAPVPQGPSTPPTSGDCVTWGENWTQADAGSPCGSSGSSALASLSAATASHSISNGNNSQTWDWDLTSSGTSGSYLSGLRIGESAASTGGWTSLLQVSDASGSLAIPLLVGNLSTSGTISGIDLRQLTAATSAHSYSSPQLVYTARAWTGSDAPDNWTTQNVLGSGTNPTSTLSFSHTGSSGAATVSFPSVTDTGLTAGNCVQAGAGGVLTSAGAACNGGPSIIKADATAQTASIAPIILTTPATAGDYRIACYVVLTTAATTSSNLPGCYVEYTDADTGVAETVELSNSATNNTAGTSGGNAAGSISQGSGSSSYFFRSAAAAIKYSTVGYASTGTTAMQYAIHLMLEGPF
ncbi:MAG: hypothetical protein ACRD2B_12840 [Terriglobia bacterium]